MIICDNCKKEFSVQKFTEEFDVLRDGTPVEVICFYCPECNERYVVNVESDYTKQLKEDWQRALEDSTIPAKEYAYYTKKYKRVATKLRKTYIKRVKRRGY